MLSISGHLPCPWLKRASKDFLLSIFQAKCSPLGLSGADRCHSRPGLEGSWGNVPADPEYLFLTECSHSQVPTLEINLCGAFPMAWIMVRQLAQFHHKNTVHHRPIHLSSVAFLSLLVAHNCMKYIPLVACLEPFFKFYFYCCLLCSHNEIFTWSNIASNNHELKRGQFKE